MNNDKPESTPGNRAGKSPLNAIVIPNDCCEASLPGELQRQIMDCRIPKNEREWWASRRLEKLEKALDDIIEHGVESHEDAHEMQDIALAALQA